MARQPILTTEDVLKMIELARGEDRRTTTTVVPTMQVQTDRDSFATAGNFLRNNWPILVTLAAAILYIPSQFSEIKSTNVAQQVQIDRNSEELKLLSASFKDSQDSQITVNNDIVRRLDKIQTDVDTLKAK